MNPLAHSARPERGIPAQELEEHIVSVSRIADTNAAGAAAYWTGDQDAFRAEVAAAARFHDFGKLAPENQLVLAGSAKGKLPVRHEDAGAAWLWEHGRRKGALLVASHHAGLPSMSVERAKLLERPPGKMFRFGQTINHTEQHMAGYAAAYREMGLAGDGGPKAGEAWSGLAHRIALSCLVDADHGDTARHYGNAIARLGPSPRWAKRSKALDRYVAELGAGQQNDARRADRIAVYEDCRSAAPGSRITACDAVVGTGKTTAVMAHLLRAAEREELRHIFVVLPYTNIIQQSVEVYRKALVLPGEDPLEVVAELHHAAEFEEPDLREMSVLWNAPITVLTAVQFFETLAANMPARLRKLHALPGSGIFVDEAHAAIPVSLWPQSWLWVKELAEDWGCRFVMASGSLARFWEDPHIVRTPEHVPDLLSADVRGRLARTEFQRVQVRSHPARLGCDGLVDFVAQKEGPRLVILNTVQSAAVLANAMREAGHEVDHLSTALAPQDRQRILNRVRERLKRETNWTLVATSCVEAGVDLSFRTGIRERCSVASLLQASGRVNRHGEYPTAEIWDVMLEDPRFNRHPAFEASSRVLAEILEEGLLAGDASQAMTEAMRRELVLTDVRERELRRKEAGQEWREVAELYRVIDSDTRTVVVDGTLAERLRNHEQVAWRELVRGSVQIWEKKLENLPVQQIGRRGELYEWTGAYDAEFLGYMAGVLPLIEGRDRPE
jgi:CRISPR-associated endonuclease/helicase Cas3